MNGVFSRKLLTIGSSNNAAADLSDIDFMSEKLDPRIKYQCVSSHAYYAADGAIKYADPNVWPLEYRNGVAAGRHEPEPQRTNHLPYSDKLSVWAKNGQVISVTPGGPANPSGVASYQVTVGAEAQSGVFYTHSNMTQGQTYSASITGYKQGIQEFTIGDTLLGGQPISVNFNSKTSTLPAPFNYRFADINAKWVRYAFSGVSTDSKPSGLVVYSRTATAGTFSVCSVQLETGGFVTSPIVTNGAAATRAAAFVSVQNPGGLATSLRVNYSDGTTDIINFSGASDIDLSPSTRDWGTRYITKCEYIKA
ncbi:hypothetical protein V5353_003458 [Enterobacter hormaechei]